MYKHALIIGGIILGIIAIVALYVLYTKHGGWQGWGQPKPNPGTTTTTTTTTTTGGTVTAGPVPTSAAIPAPGILNLKVGGTLTLIPAAGNTGGGWSGGATTNIAQVDGYGKVTGIAPGIAQISYGSTAPSTPNIYTYIQVTA